MREDVGDHPQVRRLLPSVLRSLTKPHKVGFKRAFLRDITTVPIHTPAGIYLGNRGAYNVDLDRLYSVVDRIVKGLFYHEHGHPLPDTYNIKTYLLPEIIGGPPSEGKAYAEKIVSALISEPPKATIGNKVFSYWFSLTEEDPNTSAWLLLFYERVPFVSLTVPPLN